jgi:hypothetical protein
VTVLRALKRPAVRIPLVLLAILGCSMWAAGSCREHFRMLDLARRRHQSFVLLLAATVRSGPEMPDRLGPLAWPREGNAPSAIEEVFLRDFAGREEFVEMALSDSGPLARLGEIKVWPGKEERGKEHELLWSEYMFRMYRRSSGGRDFALFSWPLKPGAAQLTMAWLSTEPDRIYYTSAPRYVGPEKGPRPGDLGESPFEGKVFLLSPDAAVGSLREFVAAAEEQNGRVWAVEKLKPQAGAGSGTTDEHR